jgi:hypothetical protein
MYQESFIRKNPAKFVDTAWVNVDDLKGFLSVREVCLNIYTSCDVLDTRKEMSQALVHVSHDPDVSQSIKKERVASPDLVVKSEPVNIEIHDRPNSTYRSTVTKDGREVLELFSSDDEIEIDIPEVELDKGMSSDTAVGDDFEPEMDSEDDKDPHSFLNDEKMSDCFSDLDSDSELEPSSTTWLDDDISSMVKCSLFQVTRQCTVDYIEYLSALPTYWPVPRDKWAYLIDLSDPKYDIKDKHGKLLPVDTLIKNLVRISSLGFTVD